MDSETVKVEKLSNVSNWAKWKFQLQVILRSGDILEVVTPKSKKPK